MLTKAFGLTEVKATEEGSFSGKASVYGVVDSQGDVVLPGAFSKTIADTSGRVKVLCQHNPYDVIGMAVVSDSPEALLIEGKLELGIQSAKEAYLRLKGGMIDGLSIGYDTEDDFYDRGVRHLKQLKLWEVSVVTWPANSLSRVTNVKSFGDEFGQIAELLSSLETKMKNGRALSTVEAELLASLGTRVSSLLGTASSTTEVDETAELSAIFEGLKTFTTE